MTSSIPPPIPLTAPPPPATGPPPGRPGRHRPRSSWTRLLRGRRRRVEVTEPVGRLRRLLERWAVPLTAVAVLAAVLVAVLVYLYVNDRLSTLEHDRATRKRSTDQVLAQVRTELQQARDNNDQLRRALCQVIDGVPPGRPGVDTLRKSLRCGPYLPRPRASGSVQPGAAVTSSAAAATTPAPSAAAASPARPSSGPATATAVPSTTAATGSPRPSVCLTVLTSICLR